MRCKSLRCRARRQSPLSSCLKMMLGLKVRILRALMVRGSPVWGLRPVRSCFWWTLNLPNPVILTSSPQASVFLIMSRMDPTISSASFLWNPLMSRTFSMRSFLVMGGIFITNGWTMARENEGNTPFAIWPPAACWPSARHRTTSFPGRSAPSFAAAPHRFSPRIEQAPARRDPAPPR